jgi:hypothetical protein
MPESANAFMLDMAERLTSRVQLTTYRHRAYLEAFEGAFGANVDYAQLVKIGGAVPEDTKGRDSPAECTGIPRPYARGSITSSRRRLKDG